MIITKSLNPRALRQLPLDEKIPDFLLQLADGRHIVKMHEIDGLGQRRDVAVGINEARQHRMPRQISFFQLLLRMRRLPVPRLIQRTDQHDPPLLLN